MRLTVPTILTLCAALAAPAGLRAQADPSVQTRAEPGRRMGDPIGRLLDWRGNLALSADQVRRLETLRNEFEQRNRPLIDQVSRARADSRSNPGTLAQRRRARHDYMQQHPELASAFKQLRENRRVAVRDALSILNDSQRRKVKQMRREEWVRDHHRSRSRSTG